MSNSFKQYLFETLIEDQSIVKISNVITDYMVVNSEAFSDACQKAMRRKDKTVKLGTLGTLLKNINQFEAADGIPEEMVNIAINLTHMPADDQQIHRATWTTDKGRYGTITLNTELVTPRFMRGEIKTNLVHELRHALDFYKSNKTQSHGYYSGRKQDDVIDNDQKHYESSKAEINARYAEAIASIDQLLNNDFWQENRKPDTRTLYQLINKKFTQFRIAYLFPEKEQSESYKRLFKRAVEYVQHKLNS